MASFLIKSNNFLLIILAEILAKKSQKPPKEPPKEPPKDLVTYSFLFNPKSEKYLLYFLLLLLNFQICHAYNFDLIGICKYLPNS